MEQHPFLSNKEMQMYSVGQQQHPQINTEQLKQMFYTLTSNLVKKGGSKMIYLLGDFFGVSVENEDPETIIDQFNAKLKNPQMQLKLLIMVQSIIEVVNPALRVAIKEAVQIFGVMLQQMSQQAIKVGIDVSETTPIVGELIAGVKAIFDVARAAIAGVQATANLSTVGFNAANQINQGFKDKAQQFNEKMQSLNSVEPSNRPINPPIYGGKKFNNLKKLQSNSMNRISNALKEFYGTRRKKRGTRIQKNNLTVTRSKRVKKTRKN